MGTEYVKCQELTPLRFLKPVIWSDIGSSIGEGVDYKLRYQMLTQVYPTYYIYEGQEDGSFSLVRKIPQAANPEANFSTNPYYPPKYNGPAPYIIPQ